MNHTYKADPTRRTGSDCDFCGRFVRGGFNAMARHTNNCDVAAQARADANRARHADHLAGLHGRYGNLDCRMCADAFRAAFP